jgi:hypothetical protein
MVDPFEDFLKERSSKTGALELKRKAIAIDPTLAVKRAKASVNTSVTIGKYLKRQ